MSFAHAGRENRDSAAAKRSAETEREQVGKSKQSARKEAAAQSATILKEINQRNTGVPEGPSGKQQPVKESLMPKKQIALEKGTAGPSDVAPKSTPTTLGARPTDKERPDLEEGCRADKSLGSVKSSCAGCPFRTLGSYIYNVFVVLKEASRKQIYVSNSIIFCVALQLMD